MTANPSPASSIFIENARVLTMDDADTEHEKANILIRGSKIEAVGPDVARPGEVTRVIDASGMLAMPGVTNAHFHSTMNLAKGLHPGPLSMAILFLFAALRDGSKVPLDPGLVRALHYAQTALGAIDMLKRGVTGVIDDAHYFPEITQEAIDGNLQAYADSGLRATVSLAQTDEPDYRKLPFIEDALPAEMRREMDALASRRPLEKILDDYRQYIEEWHGAADGRIHASVSISAPERVSEKLLRAAAEIATEYGVVFDSHVQEAKYQLVLAQQRYGKSLIAYMEDQGVLNERVHFNHAVWTDDRDIEILARHGCAVSHNVNCNVYAGSGVMPFRKMYDAGVPIGVGVDEVDADGTCNPWGVAKTAAIVHNITDPDWEKWWSAGKLLRCLTRGGARGMCRQHEVGMLAPGYEADLILIDLRTIPFVPLNDLRTQLIMGDQGSSVRMTMVGGQVVMEDGVVRTFDERAILETCANVPKFSLEGLPTYFALYGTWRAAELEAIRTDVGIDRLMHRGR